MTQRDWLYVASRRPRLEDIVGQTMAVFNVTWSRLTGRGQTNVECLPRFAAALVARRQTRASFPQIGRALGGRDHTTALNAVRRGEEREASDPEFAALVADIERRLRG